MQYPYPLLKTTSNIRPLFGDQLRGEPYIFDFSSIGSRAGEYTTTDFHTFQEQVVSEIQMNNRSWGIGRYLEERTMLLGSYPQMIREERVYHTGVDIAVPAGTVLFSPLDAEVYRVGTDEGLGNYGGYIALKHIIDDCVLYSFYGHLNSNHCVSSGETLSAGQQFAEIGDGHDSGGWFTHTHMQLVTQLAVDEGKMVYGYITAHDVLRAEYLFPNPSLLFRY